MGNKQNDIKNKQNQILHFDWIQDMMERNTNSSCYINILLWRLGFFSIYNLVHIRWGVREDIGAWVMRLLDCMLFIQNKTRRVSTTKESFFYAMLCRLSLLFDYAFHTFFTHPKFSTNSSHNQTMHSQLPHSLEKFLNIDSCYFHMYKWIHLLSIS